MVRRADADRLLRGRRRAAEGGGARGARPARRTSGSRSPAPGCSRRADGPAPGTVAPEMTAAEVTEIPQPVEPYE